MATDNSKAIKELLEVIKSKVGRIDARQGMQDIRTESIRDQLSVVNEKLDELAIDVKELKKDTSIVKIDLKKLSKTVEGIDEFLDSRNLKLLLTKSTNKFYI